MHHLVSVAIGIAFSGRAVQGVDGIILQGCRRLHTGRLAVCNVYQGYRNRARNTRSQQWDLGPEGFVRRAEPSDPGAFTFYGWQAPAVPGGACGGLHYPHGLADHFTLKVRFRPNRSFDEDADFHLHYKVGVPAECGALGSRLVRPKIWQPLPAENLHMQRSLSLNGSHMNVELRWVKGAVLQLLAAWLGYGAFGMGEAEAALILL